MRLIGNTTNILDIEVLLSQEKFLNNNDPILEEAIRFIEKILE